LIKSAILLKYTSSSESSKSSEVRESSSDNEESEPIDSSMCSSDPDPSSADSNSFESLSLTGYVFGF
jgi:hypothetical protein